MKNNTVDLIFEVTFGVPQGLSSEVVMVPFEIPIPLGYLTPEMELELKTKAYDLCLVKKFPVSLGSATFRINSVVFNTVKSDKGEK